MGAGLEADVQRRARRLLAAAAAILESRPLRVKAAELGVEPLADDVAVADDYRANQGVGTDPAPPHLRKLQSSPQKAAVGVGGGCGHRTD